MQMLLMKNCPPFEGCELPQPMVINRCKQRLEEAPLSDISTETVAAAFFLLYGWHDLECLHQLKPFEVSEDSLQIVN